MADSAHIVDATLTNFENEVIKASLQMPVLVHFWADWCAPCRQLTPVLEKIADDCTGAFRLARVDTDVETQLATLFGIRSLPTVVLIKDGQVIDGFMGALSGTAVREFLVKNGIGPGAAALAAAGPEDLCADDAEARTYEYDVFLSFTTADLHFANEVYAFLRRHRVRTFFSRESIPQLGNADYMEAIHDALDRAHHFVLITSAGAHARLGWVKSEWSMFVNEVRSGRKRGNILVVTAGEARVEELPIALRATQVLPLTDSGLTQLLRFVA